MNDNPYSLMMPEGEFSKAVDKAVVEHNKAFLVDPDAQQDAEENGERWRHLFVAEEAAGRHGVVLPLATAKFLLAVLEGRDPESPWPKDLIVASLRDRIGQTERRGE